MTKQDSLKEFKTWKDQLVKNLSAYGHDGCVICGINPDKLEAFISRVYDEGVEAGEFANEKKWVEKVIGGEVRELRGKK